MKKFALCFLVLVALTLPTLAHGGQPIDRQLIRLQTTTFDPVVDGEPTVAVAADAQAAVAAGPYYIVQFKGPVEAVWVRQLERLGATLLDYIPDNAHIARIQSGDIAKIRAMYAVRWVGPYRPAYKLSPALQQPGALATQSETAVYIIAFAGESLGQLTDVLQRQGVQIDDAAETAIGVVVQARVPVRALPQIAGNPAVSWVEPYVPLKVDNSEARKIINVESTWQRQGLFGAGQIVAVSDSGLSVQGNLNADFGGARLKRAFAPSEMNLSNPACNAKTNWTDLNGHGSHVAGSILGNGSNSGSNPANHDYTGSYAGMAPEAQLVFMAMNTDGSGSVQCIPLNGGFIAKGYEAGARISSNSWSGGLSAYSALSSIVNNYIWNHKDYTVLYSAGNSGANGAQTIGAPGTAKNVITVGATENNRPSLGAISDNPNQVAFFSSRGPTADGRIKPDVVAPGTRIISVRAAQAQPSFEPTAPGALYAYSDGTSMATPITAGATTLAREWLGKERGMPNPSAAFMKALMIHGAYRLPGAAIPNNDSGWGRIDLKNTLGARYAVFDDHLQGLSTGENSELYAPGRRLKRHGDVVRQQSKRGRRAEWRHPCVNAAADDNSRGQSKQSARHCCSRL